LEPGRRGLQPAGLRKMQYRDLTSAEDPSTVDFKEEATSGSLDETLLDNLDCPEADPILSLGNRRSILCHEAKVSVSRA
jgi:hypothetical protein